MTNRKKTISSKDFKKNNRRAFLIAGLSALCGVVGLTQILKEDSDTDASKGLFRRGFHANEKFWKSLFNSKREDSLTAAPSNGTEARVNGDIGLEEDVNLEEWRLYYESPTLKKTFTLQDLAKMTRVSSHSEFRCVEGWSMPIGYDGIRFSDFLNTIDPDSAKLPYVGMETPNADYYVGLDMESMLHPQTFLADRMNGEPLGAEHGEPLRLIIPIKYGIKNLKRIGRIFITSERPPDYWAENGYDWYSGL